MTVLHVVPDYSTPAFAESVIIGGAQPEAMRARLAEAGRVHLDRWLEAPGGQLRLDRVVAVSDSPAQEIVDAPGAAIAI